VYLPKYKTRIFFQIHHLKNVGVAKSGTCSVQIFLKILHLQRGLLYVALYYIQANNGISDALRINDTLILVLST